MTADSHGGLTRRTFLTASALAALAASAGCADDKAESPAGGTGATAGTTTTLPVPELGGDPFTLGVASGDPLPGSVILWTRLAPQPDAGGGMPPDDVPVIWEVAADDTFTTLAASGVSDATAAHAHTVHVDASGLEPASWYSYRFRVGKYTSPIGRTRTAPAGGDAVDSLRFAMASCQSWESGFYNAWRDVAATELDLVVFLGDYIYEYDLSKADDTTVRAGRGPECTTLDQYRDRYALYKSDPLLQAAHAHCPWVVTWDDHEVENNYAGDTSEDVGVAAGAFRTRRAAAYQAWWEHQPVRLEPPTGPDFTIYRDFSWGALANVFMLDERQYRTDQACGDRTLDLSPACDEVNSPGRTMLGEEQERWFLDKLKESKSTWNIVGNEVVMSNVTVSGAVLNYDQWDGYPAERERIFGFLDENDIRNVVLVTGDIHLGGAAAAEQVIGGTKKVVATELVGTSISSGGLLPEGLDEIIKSAVPDLKYVNSAQRGWCHNVVTPDKWTAEFRVVTDNLVPESPLTVDATFTISPTQPGLAPA